jgi:hypothetical protein
VLSLIHATEHCSKTIIIIYHSSTLTNIVPELSHFINDLLIFPYNGYNAMWILTARKYLMLLLGMALSKTLLYIVF